MEPLSCDTFVALPPATEHAQTVFGKNSDRPCDEVQEVLFFPARDHAAGATVECTYIRVPQAPHTHAVVLSRPAWLWGAEMGANEHQVCVGNEAVWGRVPAEEREALLGMDLVRLALERADSAAAALDVITALLQEHGQGGPCLEDPCGFSYHNSFLICDRKEAWILETAGRFWAAERVAGGHRNISNEYSIRTRLDREHPGLRDHARAQGWWDGTEPFDFVAAYSYQSPARIQASCSRHRAGRKLLERSHGRITAETMMAILRDKDSGINMEGMFMTTGSMVSVVPSDPGLPGVHYFTATPDPERSVFKPFVFVKNMAPMETTSSPSYGADDPVKKTPRFQSKPDRQHPLFVRHQVAAAILETQQEPGQKMLDGMRRLEQEKMEEMSALLCHGLVDPDLLVDLFPRTVQAELSLYGEKS